MRKKIWLIAIIFFLLTTFTIANTLALFETNAYSNTKMQIGKWKILVNGEDVSVADTITLSNFVFAENMHTEPGYFAPGSSATFDIEIDATGSEVSILYDLDIDTSALENHPNINFKILNVNSGEVINDTKCNGIIRLSDTTRTLTLRIELDWDNNVEYDLEDTSLIGEELEFLINANFKQYLGE